MDIRVCQIEVLPRVNVGTCKPWQNIKKSKQKDNRVQALIKTNFYSSFCPRLVKISIPSLTASNSVDQLAIRHITWPRRGLLAISISSNSLKFLRIISYSYKGIFRKGIKIDIS